MIIALYWADNGLALLLTALWGIAALFAGQLSMASTRRRLRLFSWATLLVLAIAEFFTLLRVGTVLGMQAASRGFGEDRLLLGLPLLVPGALVALVWSLPRLRRLSRATQGTQAGIDPELRAGAGSPGLTVPIQATALGAAIGAWLAFFTPTPPYLPEGVVLAALLAGFVAIHWLFQRRRAVALRRLDTRPGPRVAVRLLRAASVTVVLLLVLSGWFAWEMRASRLPDHIGMMDAAMDWGGGPVGQHHHGAGATSVTELTGPKTGEPDERFTLTAKQAPVELSSGATIDAWTFNGQAPGPELRVHQGDLVEVKLINDNIADGVTIHWHGVDVPNAEDGVAGVTQNAVQPDESYTYRFIAEDAGTYWYHSHQQSSKQVKKGLFGPLVVLPRGDAPTGEDITITSHSWPEGDDQYASGATSFGRFDTVDRRAVAPGTPVRLRLINTDSYPMKFELSGTPFKVAAIDGTDLNKPTDLSDTSLKLAAGGRYDLTFTMPRTPVVLRADDDGPALLLSQDGKGTVQEIDSDATFDPSDYGSRAPTPFNAESHFDREFEMVLGNRFGFYDGRPNLLYTINGKVFPDTPMFMVQEGDLVKVTFINHSFMDHPMHLHGHHILVLSRNGDPVSGSPWWTDTLNVAPGETYEVAFRADNPGLWMDHCHNLNHAAVGMVLHLGYDGITSPFEVGHDTPNHPE